MPDTEQQRRSQTERRAESDRRMIAAALKLIARHGSTGASLAQIGVEAGYSRGLPVARFGTKLALLEAVVDAHDAWFHRRLARALGDAKGLEALFIRMATHMAGARDSADATIAVYQLYVESMGAVAELRPRIQTLGETYRQGFRRHLEEARVLGEIRADVDVDQYATMVLGAVRGVIIQSLVDRGATDLDQAREQLFAMFRKALAVEKTE